MKRYIIEKSFAKSAKGLPKDLQLAILDFIEAIEAVNQITEISNIKKLKANKKEARNCYRYKTGNYRFGFILEEDNAVRLVVADHRKNIYKSFP